MVEFKYGIQKDYDDLNEKNSSTFYYTIDTKHFYLGNIELSSNIESGSGENSVQQITCSALGDYSCAEGHNTKASGNYQHVQGKYNIEDSLSEEFPNGQYAHIVGNGTAEDVLNEDGTIATQNRSNAHTLDWSGNAWYAGDVYVGGASQEDGKKLATKEYVDNFIVTYGKTTFEEIKNAIDIGKEVILVDQKETQKIVLTEPGIYDSDYNFYLSVDDYDFSADTIPPNSLSTRLPLNEEFILVVPEEVTSIGAYSLYSYKGIFKTILLPESLKTIGNFSMAGCHGAEIIIPNSVTSISSSAFYNSSALTKIYYSGSATGFPWGATNATLLPNDGVEYDFGVEEGYLRNAFFYNATDDTFNFYEIRDSKWYLYTCNKDNSWACSLVSKDLVCVNGMTGVEIKALYDAGKGMYADTTYGGNAIRLISGGFFHGQIIFSTKAMDMGYFTPCLLYAYVNISSTLVVNFNTINIRYLSETYDGLDYNFDSVKALSAKQGYVLNNRLTTVEGSYATKDYVEQEIDELNIENGSGINSIQQEGTTAGGSYSHAEGYNTTASGKYQHVQGKYNIEDTSDTYAHIIGNGKVEYIFDENGELISIEQKHSNAHTVDWDGNAWYAGNIDAASFSEALFKKIYPVGSIYMSIDNTNPSTLFGGTWKLTDRDLADKIADTDAELAEAFTKNTKNVNAVIGAFLLVDNILRVKLRFDPKVQMEDTETALGTVNLSYFGIDGLTETAQITGISDAARVVVQVELDATGKMKFHEAVGEGRPIEKGENFHIEVALPIPTHQRQVSFCNKFYWQRTA